MSAGTRRIGANTLAVPVDAETPATSDGLRSAWLRVPGAFRNEIAEKHLDRAYTDTAGQRWFLIKVVWRNTR